jgi:hypothetical protein
VFISPLVTSSNGGRSLSYALCYYSYCPEPKPVSLFHNIVVMLNKYIIANPIIQTPADQFIASHFRLRVLSLRQDVLSTRIAQQQRTYYLRGNHFGSSQGNLLPD